MTDEFYRFFSAFGSTAPTMAWADDVRGSIARMRTWRVYMVT